MDLNKAASPYEILVESFEENHHSKVRVMICQLDFDHMKYIRDGRLLLVSNDATNRAYMRRFMSIAAKQSVDLLVFPELTVHHEFVDEMVEFANRNDMYIVGGTYYKSTEKGYLSICPVVTPKGLYLTEKISPSPFEQSSFNGGADGVIPGKKVRLFRNTKVGDFAVIICLDYIDDQLRAALDKDNLDLLIVTAFNSRSQEFYYSMHSDVQHSSNGLYVLYSNTYSEVFPGEGRSALFAFMDNCYKDEFKQKGCTDFNPPNKVYEFIKGRSYCIFELDLDHKKPYTGKNSYTETNVMVLEEDNAQMEERYQFVKAIKAADDKYLFIDRYYVKPKEFDEMMASLEKEHILVITGDPGIGKTYTAIRIMQEFYKRGMQPVWFYGMAQEDRDEQKEYLLNFEPQDKDIVYLEDPFGRTVFENREELKTLFANWVEKFKACKAKLIITSRAEVFKQFEKEVISGERLEEYQKELNVRKPSYSRNDLKRIARHYIKAYASWAHNKELERVVISGIQNGQLISPLMIYNLIRNYSHPVDVKTLKEAIKRAKKTDLVTQFADEIRILSHSAKILLYLVLLYGRKNIKIVREAFAQAQKKLAENTRFEGSSFDFELRGQDGHRIQRLGEKIPVYRLSHPTYEDALVGLAEKDPTCALIAETCLNVIIEQDNNMAVDIFRRFVIRYPKFLETVLNSVFNIDFSGFSEYAKLDLTRKMLLSNHAVFQEKARIIYPIDVLVKSLYTESDEQIFALRLAMLNRRKEEFDRFSIDWKLIFTTKRICGLHPTSFLLCYKMANLIHGNLIVEIEDNLTKTDVLKKFILLPTEEQRHRLDTILSQTEYKGLYSDLKKIIPDDIQGERLNKRKYVTVLNKYILSSQEPDGIVILDDGAMAALGRGAKIYPIGVRDVEGDFKKGRIIFIANNDRSTMIRSIVEMSSDDIRKYKGLHSSEIYELEEKMMPTAISRAYYRETLPKRSRKKK